MIESLPLTLQERRAEFKKTDLYPVISSEFCAGRNPFDIFRMVAAGGAKLVQIREKHWNKKAIFDLASACRTVADSYGILLIINDHVDVALAAKADGVHLGQDDLPLTAAKAISQQLLIGISTHNLEEALNAQKDGADYINIGPIFATGTKSLAMAPLGIEAIDTISRQITIPFTVMGGIKARHIGDLRSHGAERIAMVTEITEAADVTKQVEKLRSLF